MTSRSIRNWALIVMVAIALATIDTTFSYLFRIHIGKPEAWFFVARMHFTAYLIWGGILTPTVLWICRRLPMNAANWPWVTAIYLCSAIAIGVINASLRLPFHHFVYPHEPGVPYRELLPGYWLANGFQDIWTFTLIAFIYNCWDFYRKYVERQVRASVLEAQLAQSQLEMLKRQLRPHFLFNTLHTIAELMHQDVEAADTMVVRLSDLLRMSIENVGAQEVRLSLELEFLQGYLDIEKTRYRDRLQIHYDVDPETLDARTPSMLLQPLAENAIKHGIMKKAGAGSITVKACRRGAELYLSMRDSGSGSNGTPSGSKSGIGLSATRARLQCLYGDAHKLEIVHPQGGGYEVRITLPFDNQLMTA